VQIEAYSLDASCFVFEYLIVYYAVYIRYSGGTDGKYTIAGGYSRPLIRAYFVRPGWDQILFCQGGLNPHPTTPTNTALVEACQPINFI